MLELILESIKAAESGMVYDGTPPGSGVDKMAVKTGVKLLPDIAAQDRKPVSGVPKNLVNGSGVPFATGFSFDRTIDGFKDGLAPRPVNIELPPSPMPCPDNVH